MFFVVKCSFCNFGSFLPCERRGFGAPSVEFIDGDVAVGGALRSTLPEENRAKDTSTNPMYARI